MDTNELQTIETSQNGYLPFLKREWLQILLLIAPFLAIPFFWSQLPDRIPTHWDINGNINGHSGKFVGVFLLPLISIGVVLLIGFLPKIDPKQQIKPMMRPIKIIRILLTAFFDVMYAISIAAALGKPIPMNQFMLLIIPLLFLVLGNYFPKIRPNYFMGIRTPWTLESPEVWRLTHQLGGKLWVGASIIMLILEFLLPADATGIAMGIYIGIIAIVPIVYSYFAFQKITKAAKP